MAIRRSAGYNEDGEVGRVLLITRELVDGSETNLKAHKMGEKGIEKLYNT